MYPEAYLNRMKQLLGVEYGAFLKAVSKGAVTGLRVNGAKIDPAEFLKIAPFPLKKSPFSDCGFVAPAEGCGKHPYHAAGLYYMQEPTAMAAATALAPERGERVLDLCAAPGGKSTQIAAMIGDEGFLLSNEVVGRRAAALCSNIERLGFRNTAVTSAAPEKIAARLPEFFDRVIVDAPCSGEGMFRKNASAAAEWSEEVSAACAKRQLAILNSAAKTLRPGGVLVYSTCTFSPVENESVVLGFLRQNRDFEPEKITQFDHEAGLMGLSEAARLYPHKAEGEGHFAARLRKKGEARRGIKPAPLKGAPAPEFQKLFYSLFDCEIYGRAAAVGGDIWLAPEETALLSGLYIVKGGVLAARAEKNRLEPCHSVFMAAKAGETKNVVPFPADSAELRAYLRGEEIACGAEGYAAVAANGYIVGFGKAVGGRLKNKLPKGLRQHG